MARRGRGRGRGRGGGRGGGGRRPTTYYSEVKKENEHFEKYYNESGVISEDEREVFWAALRRELPASFRFTGSKGHALTVQQRLIDQYIPDITSVEYEGRKVQPPQQLEWYPEQLAWSMTTPKNIIRKFPPFKFFQKFLVSETSVGNISRQEVVSMIPPLVMDVQPGMAVLDMCAAPGSKSAQLIEMIHGGEEARVRRVLRRVAEEQGRELSPDGAEIEAEKSQADSEGDWSDDGRSTGLLIANDIDYRRAHLLVHQTKRLNSPNILVTSHDATIFPSIKLPSKVGEKRYLKFDRILADVPCSGDGTARKNVNVWKDWIPGNGLGLHPIQHRILVRAIQMLKVGGRVVYSTCSMNPIENEAVVASAIERCGGTAKVRLVDCSDSLPGLIRRPGLISWKIMDKAKRFWGSWEEVSEGKREQGEENFGKLIEGMFPPVPTSEEEKIPLERCMRVYPHLQDTGGFFIAVLEKQSEIGALSESKSKKKDSTPPVIPIANRAEIEDLSSSEPVGKLHTLGDPLPTAARRDDAVGEGNDPLVVQQNEGAAPAPHSPAKRKYEDGTEGNVSPKRAKTEEAPGVEISLKDAKLPEAPTLALEREHKKRNNQPQEEPFKYLDPNHEELTRIFEFYGISDRFPRDRFMVRNAMGEPVKGIYYTSELARDILTQNEGQGMKFVHCGVKMFMKQDTQGRTDVCPWRIQNEGLPILEPWVDEGRIVRLYKRATLQKILKEMFPKVAGDGWKELGEIGETVLNMSMGCCVLRVETSDEEDGFKERIVLPLWRSNFSVNLMLPKEDRKAMLLRLFNDEEPLIDHSQKNKNIQTEASSSQGPTDANGDLVMEDAEHDAHVVNEEPEAFINKDELPA